MPFWIFKSFFHFISTFTKLLKIISNFMLYLHCCSRIHSSISINYFKYTMLWSCIYWIISKFKHSWLFCFKLSGNFIIENFIFWRIYFNNMISFNSLRKWFSRRTYYFRYWLSFFIISFWNISHFTSYNMQCFLWRIHYSNSTS